MFKKKQQDGLTQNIALNPSFQQDDLEAPPLPPAQQVYPQPIQAVPLPPAQPQIQRKEAEIIQAVMTEEGYRYVIDANYPLKLGAVNLIQ